MAKDRRRMSKLFNVPMVENMPAGFPWNTVQAQRALLAAQMVKPDLFEDIVQALYHQAWCDGEGLGGIDEISSAFVKVFGRETAAAILKKVSVCSTQRSA